MFWPSKFLKHRNVYFSKILLPWLKTVPGEGREGSNKKSSRREGGIAISMALMHINTVVH